jgi:hypothetical protein
MLQVHGPIEAVTASKHFGFALLLVHSRDESIAFAAGADGAAVVEVPVPVPMTAEL